MKTYSKIIAAGLFLIAAVVTGQLADKHSSSRSDWKKISPFTAVSFEGETIHVEYESTPYELVSIEGIASEKIIEAAKENFGELWQKRIREDIAEVLTAAGAPEDRFVDLELKELDTGDVKSVIEVEMTEEKRAIIYKAT